LAGHCGTGGYEGCACPPTLGVTTSSPEDDLRQRAKEHVEQLPAETALGNADPAGGVDDDPEVLDQAAREEGEQQS
jgi:hypothetical protein